MSIIETSVEDEVLSEDLEKAYTLLFWKGYCIQKMNKCLEMKDEKGAHHWSLDHQRAVNYLKYLQFKKIDSERKIENEKRN